MLPLASRFLLEDALSNQTIPEPVLTDATDEEARVSLGVFTQILLLFTTLVIGHFLERRGVLWIGEAGVALLIGMAVGVIIRFAAASESYREVMTFQNEFFFLVLLPPIIFEAGFSLNTDPFLDNIGAICTFAFGGTFVSTMTIGLLMWGFGAAGMCYALSFLEAVMFGAIISATDPVTVLSVFQRLGANIDLYSLVFGESVLNDAVAIVLYRTVKAFLDPDNDSGIGSGIVSFLVIFVGSMLVGTVLGVLSSIMFKTGHFRSDHGMIEPMVVVLFAFTSYMIAEAFKLSGIVSVLFCGMLMAKYTRHNLSSNAESQAKGFFKILASLSETFVFIYIGTSLFLQEQAWGIGMTWAFLFLSLVALAVSRAVNVYSLSAAVNFMRPKDVAIPRSHQHMLWFSGLRGAIAFALSLSASNDFGEPGRVIMTTTFFIVLFTVLFNGGLSAWMLNRLGVKGGPAEGAFACRRYQNLEEAASTEPRREQEMTAVPAEKAAQGNDTGEYRDSDTGDDMSCGTPLVDGLNGNARRTLSGAASGLKENDSAGASTRARLLPVSSSVQEAVTKVMPKMQQLHERVREINGKSLSERLSDIDKKYLSKYLVADRSHNTEGGGGSPGRSLRDGGREPAGSTAQLDVSLDVSEITDAAEANDAASPGAELPTAVAHIEASMTTEGSADAAGSASERQSRSPPPSADLL